MKFFNCNENDLFFAIEEKIVYLCKKYRVKYDKESYF